jgi:anti-sigma regulatory factor (Ser/Thr protein kinase)
MSYAFPDQRPRILGRVSRAEFVGRAGELQRIVDHPQQPGAGGLLLLLAPTAGVSELLRQAYDEMFARQGKVVPIYFPLPREGKTAVSTAIEFLNAFLVQYLAFRHNRPALTQTSPTLGELLELAPPADYEWIEHLVKTFDRERFSNDDAALIRWCISVPQRVPPKHGRAFVMWDAVASTNALPHSRSFSTEIIRVSSRSGLPYLVAGMRRELLDTAHVAQSDSEQLSILKLDRLSEDEARSLVEHVARRQDVAITDEVRDLLVQQFEASPFMITSFVRAARELNLPLTSYVACEQLYVDELLGGRLARHFSDLIEGIAPEFTTRRAILGMLYESNAVGARTSVETWKRSLKLDTAELDSVLRKLHVQEFISRDGSVIQGGGGPIVWRDYLQARYRLDIGGDARALVVAETLSNSLKRAPQTMARYYRRTAALKLRDVLAGFDGQEVPAVLLNYARFSTAYKGVTFDQIESALKDDHDLLRLPQVIHVASGAAFNAEAKQFGDEERCAIAHAFREGQYTDANEVVWLTAEIDSKLEADVDLTRAWCNWLLGAARESGFAASQIWLVAREGFSPEASRLLGDNGAYGSSRQQFELLAARLGQTEKPSEGRGSARDFEMVVPMGEDNELIVAHTVEEIARRLDFRAEAINQIKHAVVEAFINASEHSLSPDHKIYQRFRVEDDKLVITISSRGIVPVSVEAQNGENPAATGDKQETLGNKRGLGLNMIRALMDEVEFERVDDGTSLRMTKYFRR